MGEKSYYAVYSRDFVISKEAFDTLEGADDYLEYGSDYGHMFAIGIVKDGKVLKCGSRGFAGDFTEEEVLRDYERAEK